jgi:acetylornithine/succinyldiaminopimelate/putrescine aminotransferase
MCALEFAGSTDALSGAVFRQLCDEGFLVCNKTGANILRIDPPMTVPEADIHSFLDCLCRILSAENPS